jgi:hypothetical protein
MKQDDVFPSKYLKAEDLDDEITLTISKIEMAEFEDNKGIKAEKPVAYFREVQKGLIINKTNWKSIAEATGEEDSDNWIGKQITLFVLDVAAFGDNVAAIRVKKTAINKAALLKRYHELLAKAETIGVDGLEDFKITAEADEATIIDAGKQLRALVAAAEAFT